MRSHNVAHRNAHNQRRGTAYLKFNSTGPDLAQPEHRGQPYEASVIRVLSMFWFNIAHILSNRTLATLKTGDQEETQATSPSGSMQTPTTTILDLPLEILQLIFSYCTDSGSRYPPFSPDFIFVIWKPITHVCRHWRAAALGNRALWTSINTETLGMSWAKVFMERSNPALVDVSLTIDPVTYGRRQANASKVAALLTTGCARLRSLHIIGESKAVPWLLDRLHTATSIRSFSLNIVDFTPPPVKLPVTLFGGQAPVREVHFSVNGRIIAPHQLFRGVTHFTSNQHLSLQDMLDSLRQMPALQSLTLKYHTPTWKDSDAPRNVPIPMPNLIHLKVDGGTGSPAVFAILHQRLTLPDGAKIRVCVQSSSGWGDSAFWAPSVLTRIKAAKGLRHMRLYGGVETGILCLWTGDLNYEEAAVSFKVWWSLGGLGDVPSPIFRLAELYDLLGVEDVLTLSLSFTPHRRTKVGRGYWWNLLGKLSSVEDLELLRLDAARELVSGWGVDTAPAVLPALRSVRMVQAQSLLEPVAEMTATEERLMRLLQRSAGRYAQIRMQRD